MPIAQNRLIKGEERGARRAVTIAPETVRVVEYAVMALHDGSAIAKVKFSGR